MKLAFSTLGCPDWTFDETLNNAHKMGYQAIEVRGIEGELRPSLMKPFLPENRLKSLAKLQARRLNLCVFGASACFQAEGMEAALADGRAAVEVCAAMGIPFVRVFGGQPTGDKTLTRRVRFVAEGMNALCEYAKQTGVSILLEAHGWYNTADRLQAVVNQIAWDNFGIVWDVEHSDEADGGDFMRFYEPLRPLIRHVHLKDHRRLPDGGFQLCSVGKGDIPLREIVSRLEQDNYQGYYSLEWEKKWHPELPAPETEFPSYIRYMNGLSC